MPIGISLPEGKEPSPFMLTDCVQGRQRDAASMAEILSIIGTR